MALNDLSKLTTLGVGGSATKIIHITSEAQLISSVIDADNSKTPLLILGGGFYRRLAEATLLADPNNRSRVLGAFPEIIQIYGPQTHFHRQLRES